MVPVAIWQDTRRCVLLSHVCVSVLQEAACTAAARDVRRYAFVLPAPNPCHTPDSIWNTAIGSGAVFAPANLYQFPREPTQIHNDQDFFLRVTDADPMTEWVDQVSTSRPTLLPSDCMWSRLTLLSSDCMWTML